MGIGTCKYSYSICVLKSWCIMHQDLGRQNPCVRDCGMCPCLILSYTCYRSLLQPLNLILLEQFIRSVISWAVTDLTGRVQGITPLYGSRKRYPILAVRGFMGTVAMSLYYEAFERLMLGEAVSILLRCCSSALFCLRVTASISGFCTTKCICSIRKNFWLCINKRLVVLMQVCIHA